MNKERFMTAGKDAIAVGLLILLSYIFIFCSHNMGVLNGDAGNGYYAIMSGNARTLMNGEAPLWNPYQWGGFSNVGHIYGAFNPIILALLYICWDSQTSALSYEMLSLLYFIHFVICSCGFYYLSKYITKNRILSWCCAVMGLFCGCMLYGYHWAYLFMGFCYIPWFLNFYMRALEEEGGASYKLGSLAALCLGMIGLSSTSHGFFFVGIVMFFLFVAYLVSRPEQLWASLKKSVYIGLTGLAIAAIQLIPFIEFMLIAFRVVPSETGVIDYSEFIKYIVPATDIHLLLGGHTGFSSMSIVLFLLSVISWFIKEKASPLLNCARMMWVFALCVASGTIIVDLLFYIPGFNMIREQFLYTPYLAISSSIMAAYALEALYRKMRGENVSINKLIYPIAGILFIISLLPLNNSGRITENIINLLVVVIAIIILINQKRIPAKWKCRIVSGIMVAISLCEWHLYRTTNSDDSSLVSSEAAEHVRQVEGVMKEAVDGMDLEEGERILAWSVAPSYPSNIAGTIGAYDCLAYVNPSYEKTFDIHFYMSSLVQRVRLQNIRYIVTSAENTEEFLEWLNVMLGKEPDNALDMYASYDDMEVSQVYVYEQEPLGSGWLIYEGEFYDESTSKEEIFGKLNDDHFDLSECALINQKTWDNGYHMEAKGDISEVELKEYNTNSIKFLCNTNAAAVLATAEYCYPGWSVYVDGKRTNILEINYAFRGVYLGSGQHEVEFRYQPLSFLIGMFLTIAAICVILFVIVGDLHIWKWRKENI